MEEFVQKVRLETTAEDAYAWHTRPGAFQRLTPPWETVELLKSSGPFEERRVVLATRLGPFRKRWVARHQDVRPGRAFSDVQESGPFSHWNHEHRFEPEGTQSSWLVDHVSYSLPGGLVGNALGRKLVHARLEALFDYRHRVTASDLAALAEARQRTRPTHVLVTGASGLIGSDLVSFLEAGGHRVRCLGRSRQGGAGWHWNPAAGQLDPGALDGTDAVVHLAGANVGHRWTREYKEKIRDSRVMGTRLLCERIANLPEPPKTLVCASAIGFYGDRGDQAISEKDSGGDGFLPAVSREWEAATEPARRRGVRVVHLRFGIVLSSRGGALARMLPAFRLGLGGKLGTGRQFMSWISIDDAIGVIHRALVDPSLEGPVNGVTPQPVRNSEFTRTLGETLRRPAAMPIPSSAIRLVFGEMGETLLLASTRVIPKKLLECGYVFRFPELEGALRHLLGKPRFS